MFKKNLLLGLICIFISLLPLSSIFLKAQNDSEQIKLFEMNKCIEDKQIPCRWVPDLGNSYGYPLFNYHAPLPFYFGELIYLLTNNFAFAVKVMFAAGFIGAYVFTYVFTSRFLKKNIRVLSAVFYTIATFLTLFIFPDTSMGQIWGMMFFPLVLLRIEMLSQRNSIQNILVVILSFAFLILSSNNFFFFLPLIFLWIVYQYIQRKNTIFIPVSIICIFSSFLLSAFYFFPFILEKNLVHSVFAFDYLPRSVKERAQTAVGSKYQILTGESRIYDFRQGTNWFKFKTETKTHTIIRISQYYFPEWKIIVNGKEANIEYKNNSLGLMTIILGKGNHIVEARLFDTPIRILGNYLTIVIAWIILIIFIAQIPGIRRWFVYYRKGIS